MRCTSRLRDSILNGCWACSGPPDSQGQHHWQVNRDLDCQREPPSQLPGTATQMFFSFRKRKLESAFEKEIKEYGKCQMEPLKFEPCTEQRHFIPDIGLNQRRPLNLFCLHAE